MAKKKAAAKQSPAKKKQKPAKEGFSVFVDRTPKNDPDGPLEPDLVLQRVAQCLKNTNDATRWIKENAEEFHGEKLVIAQIKTAVVVKVTQKISVTLE